MEFYSLTERKFARQLNCREKIIKEEFPVFPKGFTKSESVSVQNSNGILKL